MKILKGITTYRGGEGGHYISLLTISNFLEKFHKIDIVNFGTHKAPALLKSGRNLEHCDFRDSLHDNFADRFTETIKQKGYEVLHSYDSYSCFVFSRIARILKIPHVHTKCGGPPAHGLWPEASAEIYFSKADLEMRKLYSQNSKNKHYLPNRVISPVLDLERIDRLKNLTGNKELKILCICRICNEYRGYLESCLNLLQKIKPHYPSCCLVVIGKVQDSGVCEDLFKREPDLYVLTEKYWTTEASGCLGWADFVIGQGRSFMEAAIAGKPVLALAKGKVVPQIVDPHNIDLFFTENFTSRASGIVLEDENWEYFTNLIEDGESYQSHSDWMTRFAQTNFLIDGCADDYAACYKLAKKNTIEKFAFSWFWDLATDQHLLWYLSKHEPEALLYTYASKTRMFKGQLAGCTFRIINYIFRKWKLYCQS